jgi:hypothetical protein
MAEDAPVGPFRSVLGILRGQRLLRQQPLLRSKHLAGRDERTHPPQAGPVFFVAVNEEFGRRVGFEVRDALQRRPGASASPCVAALISSAVMNTVDSPYELDACYWPVGGEEHACVQAGRCRRSSDRAARHRPVRKCGDRVRSCHGRGNARQRQGPQATSGDDIIDALGGSIGR